MKKLQLINRVNREVLLKKMYTNLEMRTTISFYKYCFIENPEQFRDTLYLMLDAINVKGRVYLAHEGINAQISVPTFSVELFRETLNGISFLDNIRLNTAIEDTGKSFFKLAIKVKEKIVADGLNDDTFNAADSGVHLNAAGFNTLTNKTDTVLIDMRNHYESEVGYFEGAIRPDAETFREEIKIAEDILKGKEDKNIVMYCTGGIRCEKASAYFKHKGFKNVFQLDGGIIQYTKETKALNLPNKFKGVNFVFDARLSERISDDIVAQCDQCGAPCDTHKNCENEACNLLFIQCDTCAARYQNTCCLQCADFIQLPIAEQKILKKEIGFLGAKLGKGRKARDM